MNKLMNLVPDNLRLLIDETRIDRFSISDKITYFGFLDTLNQLSLSDLLAVQYVELN